MWENSRSNCIIIFLSSIFFFAIDIAFLVMHLSTKNRHSNCQFSFQTIGKPKFNSYQIRERKKLLNFIRIYERCKNLPSLPFHSIQLNCYFKQSHIFSFAYELQVEIPPSYFRSFSFIPFINIFKQKSLFFTFRFLSHIILLL